MDSSARLRAADLRATMPRITALDVLDEAGGLGEHLTAAELHGRVAGRLGAVSLQAVYDCLDAFERAGLVSRIQPAGHAARFEARVGDNHHHVVCRSCGRTDDVDCTVGEAPCLLPGHTGGFTIERAEVTFWGLCPACAGTADHRLHDAHDRGHAPTTEGRTA